MNRWQFSLPELLWLMVGCAVLAAAAWLHVVALWWAMPLVVGGFVAWRLERTMGAVVCGVLAAMFWTIALSIPTVWLAWGLTEAHMPFTLTMFVIAAIIGVVGGYLGARIERSRLRRRR